MPFLRKKQRKLINDREALTGIVIDSNPVMDNNKTLYTCLMNGVLLFMVMLGTIGCFMSAFGIPYNEPVVGVVSFIICMIYGMFYYRTGFKVAGFVLVLILFGYGIMNYGFVIRSGFAAITNIFMVYIEGYLDLPVEREYTEYVTNRNYTVTLCLIFIVLAFGLMLNIIISEVKGSLFIIITTFPIVQMGLYFEEDINLFYFAIYAIGVFLVSMFRNTVHYKLENRRNKGYQETIVKKNRVYNYVTDGKNNLKMAVLFGCFMLVMILIVTAILPKDRFEMNNKYDYLKDDTEEFAREFAIVGLYGMLFDGGAAGGIDRNRLGTSKYVKFDFEKDLILYVPDINEMDSVYLKGYVGAVYDNNSWITLKESGVDESTEEMSDIAINTLPTLAKMILEKNDIGFGYRGMLVNVGASSKYPYIAYYNQDGEGLFTDIEEEDNCQSKFGLNVAQKTNNIYWDMDITYNEVVKMAKEYNIEDYPELEQLEKEYREYVYEMYMDVPEENSVVIREFIDRNGLDKCEDKVEGVKEFLYNNYEYSLIPGKVPKDKDFVNYFLTENNKGYCTYFATSAVLFYRELGIPARYVGGYAIGKSDILSSGSTKDEYYTEFIFKNEIEEKGIREIEIDDSHAHAWVEVYVDGLGWIVTDPTPPDYDSEEEMQEIAEEEGEGSIAKFITTVFSEQNARNVKAVFRMLIIMLMVGSVMFACSYTLFGIYVRKKRMRMFGKSLHPRTDIFGMAKYMFNILKAYKCKYTEGMTYKEYADKLKDCRLIDDNYVDRIFEIYEKAKYCEDEVSESESKELYKIVYDLRDTVYMSLKWYKKIAFKYFKLL